MGLAPPRSIVVERKVNSNNKWSAARQAAWIPTTAEFSDGDETAGLRL